MPLLVYLYNRNIYDKTLYIRDLGRMVIHLIANQIYRVRFSDIPLYQDL